MRGEKFNGDTWGTFFFTQSGGGLDRTARDSGGGRCNNGFKRLLDRRIGVKGIK